MPGKISKLALYEAAFIIDDSRPPSPADFRRNNVLLAAGRREEAVDLWNRNIGLPDEMIAGMRASPWWPGLLAVAPTLSYDMAIMGDTQSGSPQPLLKWAGVRVPTLVMDGTLFLAARKDMAGCAAGRTRSPTSCLTRNAARSKVKTTARPTTFWLRR